MLVKYCPSIGRIYLKIKMSRVCRREEVSAEAQRALRCFTSKSSEREGSKPMPSFPDMVAYVQDKVKLSPFIIADKSDC